MDRCLNLWRRFGFEEPGEGTSTPGVDGELAEGEGLLEGLFLMGTGCDLRVRRAEGFFRILLATGLLFWTRLLPAF